MTTRASLLEMLADAAVDPDRPFSAPWEARAFAIAVRLAEAGVCTWDEFRRHLISQIGRAYKARAHGWVEPGEGYYTHFLQALENLLREKGIVEERTLGAKMREIAGAD